ncbi:hypothetical protein B0H16DRAFT_1517535 [Mycena metata]|uniref:Zn(2)-C6 fungal-type domain-containing protein n=1 Tax=Mycena metata TaxID=1033252 RepID=A0AAD7JPN5_9AGAR|nr:hypothetical protein B0H16DRAFT_1517535 [Mycena metata]
MNEKPKKPPACDACKGRRVLCHPQPNGAPCPRCVEKNSVCTTTPVARGRPRKNPLPPSQSAPTSRRPSPPSLPQNQYPAKNSSICPELTSSFVQHCFDALELTPQYNHPLILSTSIKMHIRAVSFQLHLLPPQSRVLALCIICCASLNSFHAAVLGEGPRPESFGDLRFFSSCPDLRGFGVRRAPAYRALRAAALKAAWEFGIILQPSNENAASCFLLDLLEQCDFSGASRPWANAYMSHVRALAPIWRASEAYIISDAAHWVGHLMGDALISARSRTPMLVTPNDQLLLCGPETRSLETIIVSLKKSSQIPNLSLLWSSFKSYLSHVINMSRQLSDTIAGDYARTNPLSESAVISFISSLVQLHAALALILDQVDASFNPFSKNDSPLMLDDVARTCVYGSIFGFIGLVLPFYRELEYRETCDAAMLGHHTHDRLRLLRGQAHELAVLGVRELARCLRCLPKIHYMPVHWSTIFTWAEFCAEEAESVSAAGLSPDGARDIETIVNELKLLGYSLDLASSSSAQSLVQRLETHLNRALLDMFLPVDGGWVAGPLDVERAH